MDSALIAEKAISLRPTMVEAYFQHALNMMALGRYGEARSSLLKAIALRPDISEFHFHLGTVFTRLGQKEKAATSYWAARQLNPSHLRARLGWISSLLSKGDLSIARTEAESLLAEMPGSAAANLAMAEVCIAEEGLGKAEPYVQTALTIDPHDSAACTLLGLRESEKGNFFVAESLFLRSLDLNPNQGQAYLGMSQAHKISERDLPLISQMKSVDETSILDPEESSSLKFALAKTYEDLGEFKAAMSYYDEANRSAYLARFGSTRFDRNRYQRVIGQIIEDFSNRTYETSSKIETKPIPILLVGMIRSGTTLVEQILSSHSQVAAAGELKFWQRISAQIDSREKALPGTEELRCIGELYIKELERIAIGSKYITDKYPGNYLRLGMIRSALPCAKIIHVRREPIDNAISIYTTPNRTSPTFAHDKGSIVFAYRQYQRLMEYWRSILPIENYCELVYDELVSNPEVEVRKLLEFCGLEWQEQCLSPEDNLREVQTPSLWQVRQPIYQSSKGRWRRFEPWLGDLRELL